MPAPSVTQAAASRGSAFKRAKHRLTEALSTLTTAPSQSLHRQAISTRCRLAGVSRNTLYRYYPDIAETVRRLRRRHGAYRPLTRQSSITALRMEVQPLPIITMQRQRSNAPWSRVVIATLPRSGIIRARRQRAFITERVPLPGSPGSTQVSRCHQHDG